MKKMFVILLVLLPLLVGAVLGLINENMGALLVVYVGLAYIIVTLIILAVNIKNL